MYMIAIYLCLILCRTVLLLLEVCNLIVLLNTDVLVVTGVTEDTAWLSDLSSHMWA